MTTFQTWKNGDAQSVLFLLGTAVVIAGIARRSAPVSLGGLFLMALTTSRI
jgi:hypothetical protein